MRSDYALITGASQGIGLALATEFAKDGYNLLLVALPHTNLSTEAGNIKLKHKVDVRIKEIDLLALDSAIDVRDWINGLELRLTVLVNNAGIGYAGEFRELNSTFISNLIDLNIKVTTLLTHALIPILAKEHQSYILNMSSAAAFYSMPYKSVYAASKKYVKDFSLALKEELKPLNISVTAVCPAGVITTAEIRQRIDKAGFLAKKSALEAKDVARLGKKALMNKRNYIVPGKIAGMMALSRYLIPKRLQRKIIARNFRY